jgi:hypothetical protein
VAEYRGRLLAVRTSGQKELQQVQANLTLQLDEHKAGLASASRLFGVQAEQNQVFHERLLALEKRTATRMMH